MDIREQLEQEEFDRLAPYAAHARQSRGRARPDEPCTVRTCYQRDTDRILHSKSFRRLMHKTQVFLQPEGDHYRTRMTHTLEVARIARTIARALRLNEDLTEAAAFGHDLGHTPFGHAGEYALREIYGDFHHNEQSLRVVDTLEKGGEGLNLTYEVRMGIVGHTGPRIPETLEGQIIRYADRIAYINHDIDDACRAGVMTTEDIPAALRSVLGQTHSDRIDTMVSSVIAESTGKNDIIMAPEIWEATEELHRFMFANVYLNPQVKGEEGKAKELVARLYDYYVAHPDELPGVYHDELETEEVGRCVCDFVAGMTDRYAIETYRRLFIPEVWRGLN